MSFEEWKKKEFEFSNKRPTARQAWEASKRAEGEACAKIAKGVTAYTQFQTKSHYVMASVIEEAILKRSKKN